jgi:ornithine cyclodeaminase/alanine dehydrogenase-like protein (mu-crystallin family)
MVATDAGAWPAERVTTLPELVDRVGDWTRPDGITVFKSVGTAVQDLAAAHVVATAARAHGVGREVELLSAKTF